jgi:hypothetical protein
MQFEVPDDLVAGAYSNVMGVWHTPYEFTLDFGVFQPARKGKTEDGDADPASRPPPHRVRGAAGGADASPARLNGSVSSPVSVAPVS